MSSSLLSCLVAGSALVCWASVPGSGLDAAGQGDAVRALAKLLREEYVFPKVGETAAEALEQRLRAGAYATPVETVPFAEGLTRELAALTKDKHVRVMAQESAPGPVRLGPGAAPGPGAASEGGVVQAELREDGIGYLRLDRFGTAEESRAAFAQAMGRLAGSKALIVDLRANGGGADGNVLLASYFFGEPVFFSEIRWRKGEPLRHWTDATVSPRLPELPLYVLISGRTFSAAEGFAYNLQQRGRATVVGERSGGGANPVRFVPLGHGLMASISIGQAVNPVSHTNWEGTGVIPSVEVAADEALDAAIRLARQAGPAKGR